MQKNESKFWIDKALEIGFTHAAYLNPTMLIPMTMVREMCAENKCHAYHKNWTCPPFCGTLEECAAKMQSYQHGILLQTVGTMQRVIDTKAYIETEKKHLKLFRNYCNIIRDIYPNALCLGSGGCRICADCAYPAPCRFPEKAYSSMEGYGLFVTQVCNDAQIPYYYGEKTITYMACILY